MDEKRICDYFVVAGTLTSDEKLSPIGSSGTGLPPITDIAVIMIDQGETVPDGYTCIDSTPTGHTADLNHGSIRASCMFLCYKRGTDKPPLVDIGVLYEAKERVMSDSEIVLHTPNGHCANVNNSSSKTFLTYRRAKEDAPCNQLVVIDICVLLVNKGETPPHAYCLINKNLNKVCAFMTLYTIRNDLWTCFSCFYDRK